MLEQKIADILKKDIESLGCFIWGIEISGGSVAGFIFIINLYDLPGNELLKKKSYFTESLIEFPGH